MPGFDQANATDREWAMRYGHLLYIRTEEAKKTIITASRGFIKNEE
jgi:hypothetical protein